MSKNAHYNPKSLRWLISLAIMLALSIGVIFGTQAISKAVNEKNSQSVEVDFSIASTRALPVINNELGVTAVSYTHLTLPTKA